MTLIAHEVPLDLLETSLTFNDYQYCLPHYYVKYPSYKEFFLRYKNTYKGNIILDNGLYEGEVLPESVLLDIIAELNPSTFVLPDAWNNSSKTLHYAEQWLSKIGTIEPMIVVQGKNYSELRELVWEAYDLGIRYFGFNHLSKGYDDVFPNKNELVSKMMGRIITINRLFDEDVWDQLKKCKIHLLGCSIPQELFFHNKDYIYSVDTANPIIVGALGKRYSEVGIAYKPEEKIEAFMTKDLAFAIDDIIFNVNQFKKWCI